MAKDKKPFDFQELVRLGQEMAINLGVDAALWLIVTLGSFAALTLRASPTWVFSTAALILGGWLVNKGFNAYLEDRRQSRELERLKLTQGVKLLELHKDRQRQLPLSTRGRNGQSGPGTDGNDEPDATA